MRFETSSLIVVIWLGFWIGPSIGSASAGGCGENYLSPAITPNTFESKNLTEMIKVYHEATKNNWDLPFEQAVLDLFDAQAPFTYFGGTTAVESYLLGSQINLALRGHDDVSGKPVAQDPYKAEINTIDRILPYFQLYEGVCFRGASYENEALKKLKVGDTFLDPGYGSTSLSLLKASSFASRYSWLTSVIYVIKSKSGRVMPRSMNHRREWEILFPRDRTFRVLKIIDSGYEKKPIIFLQEI